MPILYGNQKPTKCVGWEDVCKTKSEGGLSRGIFEEIEKVVSVKLVWNFIQQESI